MAMTINEVKKALYKEKPIAYRRKVADYVMNGGEIHRYYTTLANGYIIGFTVPRAEMGEQPFEMEQPAQLLIRWLSLIQDEKGVQHYVAR